MLYKMTDGTFFYHVPKTGGRAYKAFNCDKGNGNASSSLAAGDEKWDRCPHILGSPLTEHHIAKPNKTQRIRVIIRDPVDRFLSAYYFTKRCSVGGPHKTSPIIRQIKKWRHCPNWGSSPFEMVTKILNHTDDIDKLNFFHFNSQHKWHSDLKPKNVIYIDFKDLNFKERLGKAPRRAPLQSEHNLSQIVDAVKILYKKDYDYFQNISRLKSITDAWL